MSMPCSGCNGMMSQRIPGALDVHSVVDNAHLQASSRVSST
jgi:hypothetical protein